MKTFFLFALLALSTQSAYALNCNNATTQADINQCANADYKHADAQLNKAYREVYSRADATLVPQLKTAQNAWIKFRDADCSFQTSSARGGSMYASVLAGCLEVKTLARTKELSALLHCKEGDTTCVFSGN
ncbi:lysozyme inhibitor LprI family protein [Advenella mimigardefordensis]|uniref:lysozyme inhibitor LprI family protein n=1 Tax=Advenella mimigardefordensis TaxID=302406 RepID=UPI00046C9E1A|nr:lysozyme inhibitor LprI family protein [Advenella mimigardefordensis]